MLTMNKQTPLVVEYIATNRALLQALPLVQLSVLPLHLVDIDMMPI